MVNSTNFAKRLQKILDYYSISATTFSEKIDFNRSTISHLLSGRNKPSLEFVMKVLHEFPEVELYWLLNGTGSFPSSKSSLPDNHLKTPDTISTTAKSKHTKILDSEHTPTAYSPSEFDNTIERIVIFYKDGSFKSYQ